MNRVLAIAAANFRRTLRDRLGLFFIIVLPMILIVVLGITYGGQGVLRIGIVDLDRSVLSRELLDAIAPDADTRLELRTFGSPAELEDAVARGRTSFGLTIEAAFDATLRAGGRAGVVYVEAPTTGSVAGRAPVERAVASIEALVRAARFSAERNGTSFEAALQVARTAGAATPGVAVAVEAAAGVDQTPLPGGFTIGAQSQLILFMFLTSLTGATELIVTRQLGISRRMFATPTGAGTIIAGESVGRLALALFQGAFIVIASTALFGVEWGDPAGAAAIVVVFSFVAAGAAMLVGALARNESQAGAIGPALGMGFGLLGGTMVPPEVFPETMRTIGHLTPHAWAMDAFRALTFDGADLAAILPELAVLLGFAVALLGLATVRFRRTIVG
ncbi:MAG TPA: ABC transporter permease [Candidatus Limnocylindrales bacterium]